MKTEIKTILDTVLNSMSNIEGPFYDPFNGKRYFTGIIDNEMKVKFDIKYVEYGKTRIIQENNNELHGSEEIND